MKLFTTDSEKRWVGIGTVLAFLLVVSLPLLVALAAYGVASLSAIPQGWFMLYAVVTLTAAAWTFGEDTVKAAKEIWSGNE